MNRYSLKKNNKVILIIFKISERYISLFLMTGLRCSANGCGPDRGQRSYSNYVHVFRTRRWSCHLVLWALSNGNIALKFWKRNRIFWTFIFIFVDIKKTLKIIDRDHITRDTYVTKYTSTDVIIRICFMSYPFCLRWNLKYAYYYVFDFVFTSSDITRILHNLCVNT